MRSSSGVNVRPIAAPTPSTGKYVPETSSPFDQLGGSVEPQAELVREAAKHARKNRVVRFEIPIHRIGDRVVTPVAAVMKPLHMEQDQLLRILHRHQAKQHLIQQRKDGGVRADAERQRQQSYRGEHRRFAKGAQGKLNIFPDGSHCLIDYAEAVWLVPIPRRRPSVARSSAG